MTENMNQVNQETLNQQEMFKMDEQQMKQQIKSKVKQNQVEQQMNQQQSQQPQQEISSEPRTIVNGKVVPLQQAVAMEEEFNMQEIKTGIQAHHDNSTESVEAGAIAKNSNMQQASQMQQEEEAKPSFLKQANQQSGQSHLEGMQGGMSKAQMDAQEDQKQLQKAIESKRKTRTSNKG